MKTIHHYSTLFYYDGPQVFEARDAIGGHYVAVLVDLSFSSVPEEWRRHHSGDCYLVTGVAPEQLRRFRSGVLDLRSLLMESDRNERYLAIGETGIDHLKLKRLTMPLTDCGLLPDPGFLLHDRPTDNGVLKAMKQDNLLILDYFKNVVKYAYLTAIYPRSLYENRVIPKRTLGGSVSDLLRFLVDTKPDYAIREST